MNESEVGGRKHKKMEMKKKSVDIFYLKRVALTEDAMNTDDFPQVEKVGGSSKTDRRGKGRGREGRLLSKTSR